RLGGGLRGGDSTEQQRDGARGTSQRSKHCASAVVIAVESRDFIRISAQEGKQGPSPVLGIPSAHLSALLQARFLTSAAKPQEFPPEAGPEVAFAGRSNVGKSSAINALAGRKRLAFFSKTPGRTQTINFYDLGDRARRGGPPGSRYCSAA